MRNSKGQFLKGTKPVNGFEKGHTSWTKGTKGLVKPNSGSFKKGQKATKGSFKKGHQAPISAYKKGSTPWITGRKMPKGWGGLGKPRYDIRGVKSNLWQGGKMKNYSENLQIRTSLEYIFWRKSCFIRDNFTCQKYKITGGKLVVHHINNFAEFPELRMHIKSGITLSEKAHKEFHRIYGTKNNTQEQLVEFLSAYE